MVRACVFVDLRRTDGTTHQQLEISAGQDQVVSAHKATLRYTRIIQLFRDVKVRVRVQFFNSRQN